MAAGQSFFEFISIGIGIARNRAVAFDKSFTRCGRRAERIDAGAEIENLTGFDAGALRPPLDIAAMGSVD